MLLVITWFDTMDYIFGFQDIFFGLPMSVLVIILFLIFGRLQYRNLLFRYFWIAVLMRFCFSIIFTVLTIHVMGGDSTMYYTGGRQIAHSDWTTFFDFIFSVDHSDWHSSTWNSIGSTTSAYLPNKSNLMVAKFASLPILFLDSYIFTTVLFGLLGFMGSWKIYKTAIQYYPNCHKYLAYGILFFPSCILWSSGIGKDAICLFGLGLLTRSFDFLFIRKRRRMRSLLILVLSSVLILLTKSYILYFFSIAFLFYFFINKFQKIRDVSLKVVLLPVILLTVIGIGYFSLDALTVLSGGDKFAINNVLDNVATHQKYSKENTAVGNNTKFDLGVFEPNLISLLTTLPKAIFAALFRPFLFESFHPLMLFLGIENFVTLILTIIIFFRFGFGKLRKFLALNSYLAFCLFVAVLFGGFIAISTNNFGSVSRYRLPCMPFFATLLAVLYYNSKKRILR